MSRKGPARGVGLGHPHPLNPGRRVGQPDPQNVHSREADDPLVGPTDPTDLPPHTLASPLLVSFLTDRFVYDVLCKVCGPEMATLGYARGNQRGPPAGAEVRFLVAAVPRLKK